MNIKRMCIVSLFVLSGCMSVYRAYDGVAKDPANVAIINLKQAGDKEIYLVQIDDKPVGKKVNKIELLPGQHKLIFVANRHVAVSGSMDCSSVFVGWNMEKRKNFDTKEFDLLAIAGHGYKLDAKVYQTFWDAELLDVSSK